MLARCIALLILLMSVDVTLAAELHAVDAHLAPAGAVEAHDDCEDESCPDHQCHLGHCPILLVSLGKQAVVSPTSRLLNFVESHCIGIDARFGLLRPPRA